MDDYRPDASTPPRPPLETARGQAAFTAQELSNLLSGDEHHVVALFTRMAVDTLDLLPARLELTWASMDVRRPSCPLNWGSDLDPLPGRLRVGWQAWPAIWADLNHRNPRLRMASILDELGAIVVNWDWIFGREDALREWVDRAARLPLPSPVEPGGGEEVDVTESLYQELRLLRTVTEGWIRYDVAARRRVFTPDRPRRKGRRA